jgi:hypothetical protein
MLHEEALKIAKKYGYRAPHTLLMIVLESCKHGFSLIKL